MTVNIGSITVGSKLVAVTASTRGSRAQPSDASRGSASGVTHLNTTKDPDTGYAAPQAIKYVWEGPLQPSGELAQKVLADLTVQLGKPSPVSEAKGLVDKVDVLAEIPYVVRKVVNYVAGTKPYIYQVRAPSLAHFPPMRTSAQAHLFFLSPPLFPCCFAHSLADAQPSDDEPDTSRRMARRAERRLIGRQG